jgi:hypothetical protein
LRVSASFNLIVVVACNARIYVVTQHVEVSCDTLDKPEATVRFCVRLPCVLASWSVGSTSIMCMHVAYTSFPRDALALSENLLL